VGVANAREVPMVDGVEDKPPEQVRLRPFPKGRSGNPAGRRFGSRNKATMAAQELLADEAEALTRKAVEPAHGLAAFEPYNLKRRSRCRPAAGAAGSHISNNHT
jgi:hypothetical protein